MRSSAQIFWLALPEGQQEEYEDTVIEIANRNRVDHYVEYRLSDAMHALSAGCFSWV